MAYKYKYIYIYINTNTHTHTDIQGIVSQEIGISQVRAVLVFTKLTLMGLLGRSCPISQAVTRRATVSPTLPSIVLRGAFIDLCS